MPLHIFICVYLIYKRRAYIGRWEFLSFKDEESPEARWKSWIPLYSEFLNKSLLSLLIVWKLIDFIIYISLIEFLIKSRNQGKMLQTSFMTLNLNSIFYFIELSWDESKMLCFTDCCLFFLSQILFHLILFCCRLFLYKSFD